MSGVVVRSRSPARRSRAAARRRASSRDPGRSPHRPASRPASGRSPPGARRRAERGTDRRPRHRSRTAAREETACNAADVHVGQVERGERLVRRSAPARRSVWRSARRPKRGPGARATPGSRRASAARRRSRRGARAIVRADEPGIDEEPRAAELDQRGVAAASRCRAARRAASSAARCGRSRRSPARSPAARRPRPTSSRGTRWTTSCAMRSPRRIRDRMLAQVDHENGDLAAIVGVDRSRSC